MLNSRERCIRSVLLEEPDRIPLNLNIRPEPYEGLKRVLKIAGKDSLDERLKVYRALGVDTASVSLGLKGGYLPKDAEIKEGPYGPACTIGFKDGFEVRRDVWGICSIWAPDHTYTYTYIDHPLRSMSIDEYNWPEIDEETIDHARKARKIFEDYCLYGGVTHLWEIAWQLTGFQEIIKMMFTDASKVDGILDRLHKLRMNEASILCEVGVDVIVDGDDVGTQRGLMMSPSMWRRFLKPRYAELVDLCHRKGTFFLFHSDGWIEPIIPDLIEIGVDILNPIQPECMDPSRLKKMYGDKICFEGTIGVQSTLPFGSPEDVAQEVKKRIYDLGPTGLILGPTHSIQPDTPIGNILALYRAASKYGRNTRGSKR
ncbi:MAG: uroporphyrinogen decarboxylase family protein [Candidatus Bathyarchaeia archaeon]